MTKPSQELRPCLISCSVLKDEINQLIRRGDLDIDLVLVSKMFHVEYPLLDQNLRRVIDKILPRTKGKVVLVYGDLCLGPNGEMKSLAKEYGLVKVDALNCIDCLLGGHGKVEEADPNHEFMFMDPGMVDFFKEAKAQMLKEGLDEQYLKNMFEGLKGIVLLDTLGEAEKLKKEVDKLGTGLRIVETRRTGLEGLKQVITEALERRFSS